MSKKILSIIETAYRGTLEEQDDPVLWLTQMLQRAGAEIHVLLRGTAVNYAARGQDASGLVFGDKAQTNAPRIDRDLAALLEKGATVYLLAEDAEERGLNPDDLLPGLSKIHQYQLPELLRGFDAVWQW